MALVTARLERALARSAADAGTMLAVERHDVVEWHSATFAGDRHRLFASATSGERLDAWLARVDTLDLAMPGHVIADLKVSACERLGDVTRFRIDGLTVAT
ncbi:hypothetical protein [Sphingomonas adhaesiva]|uniref:hypothetical protein n=1 Tax=Sphingomonas adhaesiva TaxID=28212 RepID=UPI002FF9D41E